MQCGPHSPSPPNRLILVSSMYDEVSHCRGQPHVRTSLILLHYQKRHMIAGCMRAAMLPVEVSSMETQGTWTSELSSCKNTRRCQRPLLTSSASGRHFSSALQRRPRSPVFLHDARHHGPWFIGCRDLFPADPRYQGRPGGSVGGKPRHLGSNGALGEKKCMASRSSWATWRRSSRY